VCLTPGPLQHGEGSELAPFPWVIAIVGGLLPILQFITLYKHDSGRLFFTWTASATGPGVGARLCNLPEPERPSRSARFALKAEKPNWAG
jgi:hypothetical protein